MEYEDFIKENVKCCVSEKPLKTSANINIVTLDMEATWKFPVWGNVLHGITANHAVAFVHDDVIEACKGSICKEPIKYAVEIDGEKIIYHPVPVPAPKAVCRVCG